MDILDDSALRKNPFDVTQWHVAQREDRWVVADATGDAITEPFPTAAAAEAWLEQARQRDEELRKRRPDR